MALADHHRPSRIGHGFSLLCAKPAAELRRKSGRRRPFGGAAYLFRFRGLFLRARKALAFGFACRGLFLVLTASLGEVKGKPLLFRALARGLFAPRLIRAHLLGGGLLTGDAFALLCRGGLDRFLSFALGFLRGTTFVFETDLFGALFACDARVFRARLIFQPLSLCPGSLLKAGSLGLVFNFTAGRFGPHLRFQARRFSLFLRLKTHGFCASGLLKAFGLGNSFARKAVGFSAFLCDAFCLGARLPGVLVRGDLKG
jgi:hypothetical protein